MIHWRDTALRRPKRESAARALAGPARDAPPAAPGRSTQALYAEAQADLAAGRWDAAAAKLDELARAREVLLHLWIKGFGVRLDEP